MLKRILISAVVLPLLCIGMFHEQAVYFRMVITLGLFMGFIEYRGLMNEKGLTFSPWPGLFVLFVLLMPAALRDVAEPIKALEPGGALAVIQGLAAFLIIMASMSAIEADLERGLIRFFAEFTGPIYLGVLGLHVLLLHQLHYGGWWVLLVFSNAWVYDAGALFIGKPFGKRKFSPISPGKTWEGFFGGIAINALFSGLVLPYFIPNDFPLHAGMLAGISILGSLLAQAGDLFESMIKRYAGVKDSSTLISAHGGFLDKMDSSLFVAPMLYVVAVLVGAK